MRLLSVPFIIIALSLCVAAPAEAKLKPYILASEEPGDLKQKTREVKAALKAAGFKVVGHYGPYAGAKVLAITNRTLKKVAGASHRGGFGAVLRVSITRQGKNLQVAYSNPPYWRHAFRLRGDLTPVKKKLEETLGNKRAFGGKGITPGALRKYHYMVSMPYFDDQDELGTYGSLKEALDTVEANLAAKKGGTKKVYRVKIPGKEEVVFGVQTYKKCAAEKHYMGIIDKASTKSLPHLPYQLLISRFKGEYHAYALRGRFRIAVSFPGLTMGTFMKINCAPGEIQDALEAVAGGE